MKPILFEKGTTDFTTNGIGRLSDAISCVATEARNGSFEVVLKYPIGGKYREEIVEGRILYTIHDDTKQPQPFDIYKVVASSKDTVTAYARHIAYRLQKYVVKPFGVIGATTAQQVFDAMQQDIVGTCPFTFYSDTQISPNVQALMTPNYPVCVWDMMGDDSEDHILYNFDGEYKYDGFTVSLLTSRGSDNGVKIRRGKNVSNIKATSDNSDMLSGVVPYWTGTDLDTGMTETVMDYDNPVVYASDSQTFSTQMIQPLDLTDAFETKPTVAEVKAMATVWLARHVYNTRDAVNYSVDLTDMTGLNDALKTVCLCDTVWLEDAVLGLQRKLKVIKTVYDGVAEKLTRIEIGSAKRSLSYALKYNNSTDVTSAIPTSSANGSTSTNTAKQASTNAVKIKALESAVADLNQGGGGGSSWDGKIGGTNNAYGTIKQYTTNTAVGATWDNSGITFNTTGITFNAGAFIRFLNGTVELIKMLVNSFICNVGAVFGYQKTASGTTTTYTQAEIGTATPGSQSKRRPFWCGFGQLFNAIDTDVVKYSGGNGGICITSIGDDCIEIQDQCYDDSDGGTGHHFCEADGGSYHRTMALRHVSNTRGIEFDAGDRTYTLTIDNNGQVKVTTTMW